MRGRWTNAAVVAAVVVGIGLRIWVAVSGMGTLDSDEAVWGLMADRTLHGHPAVFFWHQAYGGTQEVFALAAAFAVTGGPSIAAMRVVQVGFYAAAALVVWRIGRRTIGEDPARVAAALFWIWPAYLVWRSTREYGFYGSGLVISLLIVLVALRLRERAARLDAALLGFLCGTGLWATPQIAFVAVPVVAWLVWRAPPVLRLAWLAVPAALVGAAPWLVWNLRHGWASLDVHAGAEGNSYFQRLKEFAATTLPEILGLRVPWSLDWLVGTLPGRALVVAAVAGVVWLAWRRRGRPVEPLVAIALGYPFLYALSPYDWLISDPRYMTLLAPIAALLLAYAAGRRAPLLLAAALALTIAALVPIDRDRLPDAREGNHGGPVPRDVAPAIRALDEAGATRIFAPYWTAYRIQFESGRRILASPISIVVRDDRADRLVRRSPHPAWVFPRGEPLERTYAARLAGYRHVTRGDWSLYLWPRAR